MKLEEAKKKLDYHKNIIASLDEKSELFEAIKTVLQSLENSISEDKVKEKIGELKEYIVSLEKQQNELIALGGDDLHIRDEITNVEEQIKILKELLEDK